MVERVLSLDGENGTEGSMSTQTKQAWTPGPWRDGRRDMQSYDGETGEMFASVYCDDDRAPMHLGERLPYVIARTFGDECKANALLIAKAPELVEALNRIRGKVHATLSQESNLKYAVQTLEAIDELAERLLAEIEGDL